MRELIEGRAAITKLNGILWDRDVTPKTKTHIYQAIVKKVHLHMQQKLGV
jgi:hypothetical protein